MEYIPEVELKTAENLIVQHHKIFVSTYFRDNVEDRYKTFISILL